MNPPGTLNRSSFSWTNLKHWVENLLEPDPRQSSHPINFTIDAETLTREAKETRLLHTPWARVVQTQGHIFDHFIIVTGDKKSGKRDIIYTYPPSPPTLQNLEFFAFPDGYNSPHLPKTRAMDQQGSGVFVRHLKDQQRSFIFLLTNSSNEIFYGICVLDDMLPQPPLFLHSQGTVSMPLAYAFVSRYPFFSFFFHAIYSLLSIEEADQRAKRQPQDRFKGMLNKLYDCKVPPPGHEIDFVVQNTEEFRRSFGEMREEQEEEFAAFAFPTLFHLLPIPTLLRLVSAALCEGVIVASSSNPRLLSAFVMAFVPLMRPFEYQSVLVPILPRELWTVMEAPLPYVVGVLGNWKAAIKSVPTGAICVDLDKKMVQWGTRWPNLPGKREL